MAETTVVVEHNIMSAAKSNMISVSDSPVTDPGSETKVSLRNIADYLLPLTILTGSRYYVNILWAFKCHRFS